MIRFSFKGEMTDAKLMAHVNDLMKAGYAVAMTDMSAGFQPKAEDIESQRGKVRKNRSREGTAEQIILSYLADGNSRSKEKIAEVLRSKGFKVTTTGPALSKLRLTKKVMRDDKENYVALK